ncbi:MAG TPA: ethanolamine ammonia-lyase subunit EutC [Methylotenera sp.]|nr:ethanolamine ammonia-lyase subunit EutC [Methylotenera sp.]HPH05146.1 ethanolamine ammonia-lyase subunit EutC [Methylotenera sp.]HPN00510.1 ethanolamine ammonia-lyase subunit EutC [Methylotenera sp.]
MTKTTSEITKSDPWQQLKAHTRARIAIGRVGTSLPTKEVLDFGLSHAMARDAVHLALDVDVLAKQIEELGITTLQVQSKAENRPTYLLRPDLGRQLSEKSAEHLRTIRLSKPVTLLIVVGDGLSSLAVERHVLPLLVEIQQQKPSDWSLNPLVIASQARVAIADEIGEILGATITAMLIGERPGLSSPDSLGIYLTYQPKVGLNDANRNCISNVRPEGLSYATAAKKMLWLIKEALRIKASGVTLKDESDVAVIDATRPLLT